LTTTDAARLTLAEAVSDSRVMAARQMRKILRRPAYVVYLFVQPVILVLLFRYVFGGAVRAPDGISYVNYLIPGIIVMTAVFGSLTTGLGLTEDIKAGVVERFRALPIARSAVLVGRTTADLATNVATLLVMLGLGLAVGFRPGQAVYQIALALLLVLAFAYVFSWISAFVGLSVREPRDRAVGGLRVGVPADLRVLGVRADLNDAGRRARVRERQPDHAHHRRRAPADDRPRRCAGARARLAGLDGGAADRVRRALGTSVPAGVIGASVPGGMGRATFA
jgi:ABC-type transport system involved in cytochrome c biogenesis permease component